MGRYVLLALASLVAGALAGSLRPAMKTRLIVFDVGQGDCAAIVSGGATVLIDAGPKTPNFDAGARLVLPKLRRYGLAGPSLILVTHPDEDHLGGLAAIHRTFPKARVAAPATFRNFATMRDRLAEAGFSSGQTIWLPPACVARFGAVRLRLACPPWSEGQPDNDGSLFVRVQAGSARADLTGDAPSKSEELELGRFDWRADLLKAGHHGSRFSSGEAWLGAVAPREVAISCGANNRYGHPHHETLDRIQAEGARTARTDQEGDLVYEAAGDGFRRALTKSS